MSSDVPSSDDALIRGLHGEAKRIAAEFERSELESDARLHGMAWNELSGVLERFGENSIGLGPSVHPYVRQAREVRDMLRKGVSDDVLAASAETLHNINERLLKPVGWSIAALPGKRRRPPRSNLEGEGDRYDNEI